MSNKTDAAYHGSTLRDEILRAAPFSDDEGLLRRAAARIEELETEASSARARVVDAIQLRLDAETVTFQERGQIAVRQWARAWVGEWAAGKRLTV